MLKKHKKSWSAKIIFRPPKEELKPCLFSIALRNRPLTMQNIEQRAEDDFEIMFADQEPVPARSHAMKP